MKRFLLLIASLILTFYVFGSEISIEQAKKIAESYITNNFISGLKNETIIELIDVGDIMIHF